MAQKITSLFLVLAFFSYQSYHTLVYINYYVQYDYFVKVLCENKDNPEKPACNGKCHLKKQLNQQKPPQEDAPFSKTATTFYPEILAVLLQKIKNQELQVQQKAYNCPISSQINQAFLRPIFHPPKNLL